jgi:citrate lyase beta subunit
MTHSLSRVTRSMLFVPASRPAMIAKAAASAADAVCIDLEDSVAPPEKAASRAHVIQALRELDFGHRVRMVRINALDTPYAYRDLVDVVEAAGARLDLVMLPKAASARDVAFVDTLLSQIEWHLGLTRAIGIEAQIESAAGFLYTREIVTASPRLEALIFGPGDYAASMRMPASAVGELDANDAIYPGHRWHAVMHTVVAAARAHQLRAMDGPYASFKDEAGFERSCRIARTMGFDGKQCIHPAQLATTNAVFSPSAEEVASAAAIVAAFDAAVAGGQGAATHDGKMIDAASLRMARTILDRRDRRPV